MKGFIQSRLSIEASKSPQKVQRAWNRFIGSDSQWKETHSSPRPFTTPPPQAQNPHPLFPPHQAPNTPPPHMNWQGRQKGGVRRPSKPNHGGRIKGEATERKERGGARSNLLSPVSSARRHIFSQECNHAFRPSPHRDNASFTAYFDLTNHHSQLTKVANKSGKLDYLALGTGRAPGFPGARRPRFRPYFARTHGGERGCEKVTRLKLCPHPNTGTRPRVWIEAISG